MADFEVPVLAVAGRLAAAEDEVTVLVEGGVVGGISAQRCYGLLAAKFSVCGEIPWCSFQAQEYRSLYLRANPVAIPGKRTLLPVSQGNDVSVFCVAAGTPRFLAFSSGLAILTDARSMIFIFPADANQCLLIVKNIATDGSRRPGDRRAASRLLIIPAENREALCDD